MRRLSLAVAAVLACLAGWPVVAASPPPTTPCEQGLAAVNARLKKAEAGVDGADLKNGARKHYRAAKAAHRALDDETCLSEIAKAQAILK